MSSPRSGAASRSRPGELDRLSRPRAPFEPAITSRGLLAQLTKRPRDALASLQHRSEEVAVPLDPLQRLSDAEVSWPYFLAELLPVQRRRHRCPWLRAHGVD